MKKREGRLGKAKMIAGAILSKKPDTDWYKKRNEICFECPYNTKNKENLTHIESVQNKMSPACSICHCFISEKTKVEEATCGLEEIGMEPKWFPVSVPSKGHPGVRVHNLSPDLINIDYTANGVVEVIINSEQVVEKFDLGFKGKKIKNIVPSCSCVTIDTEENDDEDFTMHISVSTVGFRKGVTDRYIYVEYYSSNILTKKISINLKINKDE